MEKQKRECLTFLKHQKIRDAFYAKQRIPRLPKDGADKKLRQEVAEEFNCTEGHVYRCICEVLHKKQK